MGKKTRVAIDPCSSCGKRHLDTVLHEFNKPRAPWSHYYTCPDSGDPVPCYIATRGDRFVQANATAVDALIDAEMSGNVLAVVFRRKDDKRLHMTWATETFDRADFGRAVKDLGESLAKEGGPPPAEPLPEATAPPPEVSLFGDSK